MPGRFSVPARRPRSCPPPRISGFNSAPPLATRAPIPGGPPSLCADRLTRSAPSAAASTGILPAACTASQWNSAPCACAITAISAVRLDDTGLVVRQHDRDQRRARVGSQHRLKSSKIDDPVRIDRDALGCRRHLQHRIVLDGRNKDPLATAAEQREVIGFGAPADEDYAVGRRADQRGNGFARLLDLLPRGSTRTMHRGGVAAMRQRSQPQQRWPRTAAAPQRSSRDRFRAGSLDQPHRNNKISSVTW